MKTKKPSLEELKEISKNLLKPKKTKGTKPSFEDLKKASEIVKKKLESKKEQQNIINYLNK